jgi:aspartyl-tRNA(Asn)/glutamyl-tRNA(Gln) amidotransferase subunit A
MQLHELTIEKAHGLLKAKEISSQELTQAVFDRIDALEEKIGAFITIPRAAAEEQAVLADKRIAKGEITPLTGIPLGIKDSERFYPALRCHGYKKTESRGRRDRGKNEYG